MDTQNRGSKRNPLSVENIVISTLMLAALGVAGNYFNLPLFFSVNFIFGSIVAFIALITLGLIPALVISAIASTYTFYLWGHPYAALIFFVEILFVGLMRKRIRIFAYSDFIFWLVIGAPMIYLFYKIFMGMDTAAVSLIALKQPINGIFNAILAPLIVNLMRLLLPTHTGNTRQISAKQLVSSSLMFMTIVAGGIPIVFNNYSTQSLQEKNLIKLMSNYGNAVIEEIRHNTIVPSDTTGSIDKKDEYLSLPHLEMADLSIAVTFSDPIRRLQIGWTSQYSGIGNFQHVQKNLSIWKPIGNMPEMKRWLSSEYFLNLAPISDLGIEEVLVTHSAKPMVQALNSLRIQTLTSLIILIIVALFTSYFLSQLLIVPIKRISAASITLRTSERSGEKTIFPRSQIREFDELSQSMQQSSDEILEHVAALKEMRDNLEERVASRTAELSQLSTVASQTSNGVIITNINGVTEWVNDGLFRMTGYSFHDFFGKTPSDVLKGPKTSQPAINRIADAMKERRPIKVQILYYTKSGYEVWLEMSCNPMRDKEGNVTGFIAISNDVTERRLDRHNLIKARKEAERSNLAKSQFLSTISHEIRTPLNGIMGMVQLLSSSKMNPEQNTHLQTIKSSSNTLLAIINDVLDMSKIEAGAMEIEETSFNLQNLVVSTVKPFQALAENKSLALNLENLPDRTRELIGDPVRIRQILWNLISNAIKFTPTGSVNVTLNMLPIVAAKNENYDIQISMTVSDSGDGISPDRISDIFEPFTQEDNTVSRKFGGTGLGLSIVKQLIDLMKGTILVESNVGGGTCFTVTIPLRLSTDKEISLRDNNAKQPTRRHKKGLKILVADDNIINSTIALAFLRGLHCNVNVVENGLLALQAVKKSKPDLIFMDIHMPVMDGIKATKNIRDLTFCKDLPIIALTADAFEESKAKFLKAGMNSVLTKPFTEPQMQTILAEHCPESNGEVIRINPISMNEHSQPVVPAQGLSMPSKIPIGDDGKFDNLMDFLGQDAMHPMLKVAPGGFRKHLDAIQSALAAAEPDAIAEASHAIKGSAAALYALRLTEQAAFLQVNAHKLYQVETVLPELTSTIEDTIQWLRQK
ncbi:MAG: response regulator [Sneathiella sp.]|nr:response regulator [Sneathiella sp.]